LPNAVSSDLSFSNTTRKGLAGTVRFMHSLQTFLSFLGVVSWVVAAGCAFTQNLAVVNGKDFLPDAVSSHLSFLIGPFIHLKD
jgi:hypothetical protein